MRSASCLFSPPPSPRPAPLPLSSSSSSSFTCCPQLDLSVTLSHAPKIGRSHMKPHPLEKNQQIDQSEMKSHSRGQAGKKGNTQVCFEEPVVVTVTPEPHATLKRDTPSKQPIRTQRKNTGHHHAPREWVKPPATASNQYPGCLERVDLNTTLALKVELQSLQGKEFNSQRAIQETLRRSERTKDLINTRATEVVNVSRSQLLFTSLVSIDVQEDQLISQAAKDRLLLAPAPRCHGNKAADGPSFHHFMSSYLLRQKPLSSEQESVNYMPHPLTHHAHSTTTFDPYRKWRRCDATP